MEWPLIVLCLWVPLCTSLDCVPDSWVAVLPGTGLTIAGDKDVSRLERNFNQ